MGRDALRRSRLKLLVLNLVGGAAVLGSYAWGFATHPDPSPILWGGVPDGLRPVYLVSILAATLGYFAFTGYFLLRFDPDRRPLFGRHGFGLLYALYAGILLPSALWMPFTFAYVDRPTPALWWLVRADLAVVGLSALTLLAALVGLRDRGRLYVLAVAGLAAFTWQTGVLDALVWPWFFPRA